MKTVTLEYFTNKIHSSLNGRRIPLDVSLELTYRCNNRCVHCFCNLPVKDKTALREEMKTKEIKDILDKLSEMGCLWLLITGGEPLLRDDFEEIYLYAKKKGFIITLFTNGTLIDNKIINLLSHYPPFGIEVTLYGAAKETYEKITRTEGSYQKCLEGINKILNANLKLKLKTMAITLNRHEIADMDRMAKEFGCDFRFDPSIQRRIDRNNCSQPENYRLSSEEAVSLDLQFPYRREAFKEFCTKFNGNQGGSKYIYQCGAGRFSMHINPYGVAMGCMMMIKDGFSIREHELEWIWQEGIAFVIKRKKDFTLPCDDCPLINLCGQCPGWSMVEHGDIKTELPFLCELAKKRNLELNLNL